MIPNNPKGIIELGNIYIKCIIFQINENNVSEILSTSITHSQGIHNGVIVNLAKASAAIRSCIGEAEEKCQSLVQELKKSQNKIEELENNKKTDQQKQIEFNQKIDELNQETEYLIEEIDKWQM